MARRTTGAALVVIAALSAALAVVLLAAADPASEPPRMPPRSGTSAFAVLPDATTIASASLRAAGGQDTSLTLAERVASRFRLEVTSGYRSPEHNAAVGGVEGSFHTRGTRANPGAVDLAGSEPDMRKARAWALRHLPRLAEAMVHAVCLIDEKRPWRVADGGLHLHLAFASPARPGGHVDLSAGPGERGCPTPMDRFEMAVQAIEAQQADGTLTATRAARFTIRASARAFADSGSLSDGDRRSIVAARGAAQSTIGRALAARRKQQEQEQRGAYDHYLARLDDVAGREVSGELTHGQATALRRAVIVSALSGKYGELTAAQRALVLADRTTLTDVIEPEATTTAPATTTAAPDPAASAPGTTPATTTP